MNSKFSVIETTNIGKKTLISDFCVIKRKVKIGGNVVIHPNVVIEDDVTIGSGAEIFPGSYIGKIPKGAGAIARTIKYRKGVEVGGKSMIGPNATIYQGVSIGRNTLVGDSASIREETEIGNKCIIGRSVTINYETKIGNRVKIMDHTWLAGKMVIQDNVFISGGVMTSNDNDIASLGEQYQYDDSRVLGSTIKKSAVIGVGAILLPGVIVGKNSVVAAGAVVTKDIPNGKVVMGIPARVVRNVKGVKSKIKGTEISIKQCQKITLPKITDPRGNLTVVESERHIPFNIRRVFYIYEVPDDALRAGHALKICYQVLVAIAGSLDVMVNDGKDKKIFKLDSPNKGLLIPPNIWREMFNFSKGAVCLVFASEFYDPQDYYRDYRSYVSELDKKRK